MNSLTNYFNSLSLENREFLGSNTILECHKYRPDLLLGHKNPFAYPMLEKDLGLADDFIDFIYSSKNTVIDKTEYLYEKLRELESNPYKNDRFINQVYLRVIAHSQTNHIELVCKARISQLFWLSVKTEQLRAADKLLHYCPLDGITPSLLKNSMIEYIPRQLFQNTIERCKQLHPLFSSSDYFERKPIDFPDMLAISRSIEELMIQIIFTEKTRKSSQTSMVLKAHSVPRTTFSIQSRTTFTIQFGGSKNYPHPDYAFIIARTDQSALSEEGGTKKVIAAIGCLLEDRSSAPFPCIRLIDKHNFRTVQGEFMYMSRLNTNIHFIAQPYSMASLDSPECSTIFERGLNLKKVIKSFAPKSIRYRLITQLIQAIFELHTNKVVHGDLKCENLIVLPTVHRLKLIDFGCSIFLTSNKWIQFNDEEMSTFPTRLGNFRHMPPEFIKEKTFMTFQESTSAYFQAEMYAVGVLIHHILCGRKPSWTTELQTEYTFIASNSSESDRLQNFHSTLRDKIEEFIRQDFSKNNLFSSIDPFYIQLMKNLLDTDPKIRWTAKQAHEYIKTQI